MNTHSTGVDPLKLLGTHYIKIDVIQGKIKLVESIFDVIYTKICFIGLALGLNMGQRGKILVVINERQNVNRKIKAPIYEY